MLPFPPGFPFPGAAPLVFGGGGAGWFWATFPVDGVADKASPPAGRRQEASPSSCSEGIRRLFPSASFTMMNIGSPSGGVFGPEARGCVSLFGGGEEPFPMAASSPPCPGETRTMPLPQARNPSFKIFSRKPEYKQPE